MDPKSKIYVAGATGLVGSAIVRELRNRGYTDILTPSRRDVDLLNQSAVRTFFESNRPDFVFLAAAKVGGILANSSQQADFLYENLMIEANVISCAAQFGVSKLLFLGSSCIYPKFASQPISEGELLAGPLEPTNEGYAIAKIAGLKMCEHFMRQYGHKFVSAMPTNLYGPGDNFHPVNSHVIPGLMRRIHLAKVNHADRVDIWGTGRARREFLHVSDLASALLTIMNTYNDPEPINVGTGSDITIDELARAIAHTVGFQGSLNYDASKPDGTPRKVLDISKLRALGWVPSVSLPAGLDSTYNWALEHHVFG